ncbi:NADH-ubiquinone oxidoreductase-F iron-sulfur binding region domain-containing protein [Haloglomus litoreum]|uniref:NADH-ubiquinone oxidoreductase-F iron-sulfur binding region domain-containing protein n=1 Tax=Haloglomus litoreum TaxID=3034026 RepID=UPI0023E76FBA|nr:NADH-ubiquinone oxidoreductase-F iron-sulfur binding region domain-containing protein [Haloglomus sp. DT116]
MTDATERLAVTAGRDGERRLRAAREAAPEGVVVVPVGSTGVPALEPLALATRDGETAIHATADAERCAEIATEFDGGRPHLHAHAVVEHEPGTDRLPTPEEGPLSVGRRRVLGPCGWTRIDDFGPERQPSLPADPGAVLGHAERVGLLGRGRGDAARDRPVAEDWRTARDTEGDTVVVVNGNEADAAVAGDELLLASAPAHVLAGAFAAARVVDARDVVVYVGEHDDDAAERTAAAADALAPEDVSVQVVTGPDTFTAGEPTMALEALEGSDRIEARRRPPGPAEWGLYGRPTVVHTPRTLAQLVALLRAPDAFDTDAGDPGTRVVTATPRGPGGDAVAPPATVELPTGTSVGRALDALGAPDSEDSRDFRPDWAVVGGRFGGLRRDLDVPAGAPALLAADCGTAGAVESFADACALAAVGRRAAFAREANCGRCVPCREGSKQLHEGLRAVYDGDHDEAGLRELLRAMGETSLCAFGREAARPVRTALDRFAGTVRAHADGDCSAGECDDGPRDEATEGPGGVWA